MSLTPAIALAQSAAGVPAAVTDVKVRFPGGGHDGYVEFTAPVKDVAGSELGTQLTYSIEADGAEIASGNAYPGVSYSVDVSVDDTKVYTFNVTVANEAGRSEGVTAKAGAGFMPAATPEPMATKMADGSVSVSWPAVFTTASGADLSGEEMTYRVERYPDGYVLAEATSATSVVDNNFDGELHVYRYLVTAIWNYSPSEEGESNPVSVGVASTPFKSSFDTADEFNLFTVVDADGDMRTWQYYSGEITANVGEDAAADDWIFTPPINLSGSGFHPVSVDLKVRDADYPGIVEIRYGSAPTPEAMTEVAVGPVDVVSTAYQTFGGTAVGTADGPVYFGIHNITKPGMWWTYATNLIISASAEGMVPAAVYDLTATPDIDGELRMTLRMRMPENDLSGDPLTEISYVEIYRDEDKIHTIENPLPGSEIEYTDEDGLTEGEHSYLVRAYNKYGAGLDARINAYAGINLPATPGFAKAMETDVNGVVRIEWTPVTTYIDGSPLNPDNVTYNIWTNVTGQDMKVAAGLTGTSTTFRIIAEDEPQLFFQFGVTAETAGGENYEGIMTEYVPLGEPDPAPYEDSFPDIQASYTYVMGGSDSKTFWDNASDSYFEEVQSQDADNGMLYMFGDAIGSQGYLQLGKIDLAGVDSPMLTFYVYNMVGEIPDDNEMEVFAASGSDDYQSLGSWRLSDFGTEDWHRVAVPLDAYAGKSVRLKLVGTVRSYQYLHLDNLQVRQRRNYDLALTEVSAPERVKSGNTCPIRVAYANYGLNDAGEFSIELLRDGEVIDRVAMQGLPSDARGELTFPAVHSAVTPESVVYSVRLAYAPDQVAANNQAADFEVLTIYPAYPAIDDLMATYSTDPKEVTLQWSLPNLEGALIDDVIEGFDNASAWSSKVEGWTFVDADHQYIYGFEPWVELPANAPKAGSRQSWWVMDASYAPLVNHFSDPQFYATHSGDQCLISMAVTNEELTSQRSDDWAISPELPGIDQTISFWAKAMLEDAPETFEVLYSTTDKELDSFKSLQVVKDTGWYWTQYFFDLPEGARYFAIRAISRDAYVLMIDDVNFISAGEGSELEIEGYNIYRNKKRLNEAPVKDRRYIDHLDDAAVVPVYNVSVVYAGRGESDLSNSVSPEYSSVAEVMANARVVAAAGRILVSGAAGEMVEVYSADAANIYRAAGVDNHEISVASGVYLVKLAGYTWKVLVK